MAHGNSIIKHLRVPVTQDDADVIKSRSEKTGRSIAAFLREMGVKGYIVPRNVIELQQLIWEINKIGVNINQIVHLCNQKQHVLQSDINNILEQHSKVWDLLDRFVEL